MNTHEKLDISILYVEDDPSTREEIFLYLSRRASRVFTASNGAEGLEAYRREKPDLIVTDVRMPVMDGLEMVGRIRAQDRDTRIVVTTAHNDSDYLMKAIDAGIDQYVMKPVEGEKLFSAVEKCAETIMHRKAAEFYLREKEQLVVELQAALEKVKLLSGLLPICSSCKKIRDDKGYWRQMEAYIRDHSEAEFSHGICPDCAKKIYPEYYEEGFDKNKSET